MDDLGSIAVDLQDDERQMLSAAMLEWIGPARPTEALVVAMGFDGLDTFADEVMRLRSALDCHDALTRQDWRRVQLGAEVVFASDLVGSGLDWPSATGFTDTETLALLRSVQRKMLNERATTWIASDVRGNRPLQPPTASHRSPS